MCGFGGIVHWDKERVHLKELEGMALILKHRGPDEWAAALPAEGIGLSHCRLKVIDLSPLARQPMSNEEKTVWLVFNGEIYNFLELKEELKQLRFSFRSQSDTEVVLRAYEAWGREGIRRLDGMFALSIWDSRSRQLLLARDRTGKKPLYYHTDGRCTVFGSEIKALLLHPHAKAQVNEEILPFLLQWGYPPTGQSCYHQIRQVPPASFLCFTASQTDPAPETYWRLPAESFDARPTPEQAGEELCQLLRAAVRRRLMADVPLGAFLSGGIDSTLVVGLMSQLAPHRPVKTFSIGFEGNPRFNETGYAELVAKRFGTEHTVFNVSPPSFDLLERLVWHHDGPFGDSSALPTYLLSELTRSQVTVALNGDGGDELFAGYDRFKAMLLAERLPQWMRKAGFRAIGLFPRASPQQRSAWGRARRFLEAAQEPAARRFLLWTSLFPTPSQMLLSPPNGRQEALCQGVVQALESRNSSPLLANLLALNFHSYLPNDLNVKMDRCSMAHGLETRSPFLDTKLIEWAFRLPDRFKLKLGVSKWILRRAFPDLLPPAIRARGKMGFGVPLASWFRGRWREPLKDLLASPQARIGRYLNRPQVQQMVSLHLQGTIDASQPLWFLLTFELWLKQMGRPSPAGNIKAENFLASDPVGL